MDKTEKFYTARGYEIAADQEELTPSMEDYLEMIYRLSKKTGCTRVNDLADSLNVQPPSVSKMIQKLSERSLLNYEKYGMIHLTDEGESMGKYFLERHNTLREFLSLLGVTDNLQKDVERMEHYISVENFKFIEDMVSFFKDYPEVLKLFKKHQLDNQVEENKNK